MSLTHSCMNYKTSVRCWMKQQTSFVLVDMRLGQPNHAIRGQENNVLERVKLRLGSFVFKIGTFTCICDQNTQ